MDRDPIQEKVILAVKKIARSQYDLIPLDTRMELLAVDSIDQASLIFELEDALGIDIPDNELIEGVHTLGDLVEKMRGLLVRAVAQKATA